MKIVDKTTKRADADDTLPTLDRAGLVSVYAGFTGVVASFLAVLWFTIDTLYAIPTSLFYLEIATFIFLCSSVGFVIGVRRIVRSVRVLFDLTRVFRESRDRLSRATHGSREGLWEFDMTNGTAFFSEGWHTMLGLSPESITSIGAWKDLIHPDDAAGVWDALSAHASGLRPSYVAEYRIRGRTGTYLWVEDRGSNTSNSERGRIAGFSRDISNVKNAEDALRSRTEELARARETALREAENARRFEQAVESATDAIAIMTPNGNLTYANSAWEKLTGYRIADARGSHCAAQYEKHTTSDEIDKMKRAIRLGEPFESENIVAMRKNGIPFEASVSLYPVRDRGVISFYTLVEQDITRRKEIDRAKTEFVSLASHQLRTPLTAIRWYSEMLLKEGSGDLAERERKYVREIYEANRRMVELVDALLNVSRIDLGTFGIEPVPTDLTALAENVLKELVSQSAAKKIAIEKVFGPSLPLVPVDPQLFRMVFQNLLSNAIKYTPNGGSVRIAISAEEDMVSIVISDTGMGIPNDQKEHIFTKLFRADNAREHDPGGTGLGLYIVKAIVESSGGTIRFASEEGKGTTFYVTINTKGSPRKEGTRSLASATAVLGAAQ